VAFAGPAQQPSVQIAGRVKDQAGRPVRGVIVTLRETGSKAAVQTTTDPSGGFVLTASPAFDVEITASNQDLIATADIAASQLSQPVELVLRPPPTAGAVGQMEFSDDPHFAVAGVTDWTAAGGHGSDSVLRTSESLASTTASLPGSANSAGMTTVEETRLERQLREDESQGHADRARARIHVALQAHPTASLYRLAAQVDEKTGDSLAAVREFEQAARLDPSEMNEFNLGSELLVHRAIWQAEAVFRQGAALYPASVRMQTALGSALFAGARYEEAAERLCKASDLAPAEEAPSLFLGKVALAAPNDLPCVEPRLERFQRLHPESAEARYLYAMAILKQRGGALDTSALERAEMLLKEAVGLDPKCSDAYLERGILAAQRADLPAAIQDYTRAIAADPTMADAYYRLAKAYERVGEAGKAKAAFAMHRQVTQSQAAAAEQQRKAIKQFVFADVGDATAARP
jgi:tetratricopeptide (TPR) repeat protein